jgi:hypothetical protein
VAGIGRAVRIGLRRRKTLTAACIVGVVIVVFLLGFLFVPSKGLNIEGSKSSPPSMAGLRAR